MATDALRGHIATVVGRYRGRVHGWDVVNEAYDDDGAGFRRVVGRYPDDLPSGRQFDCIVFNDVLEHLGPELEVVGGRQSVRTDSRVERRGRCSG